MQEFSKAAFVLRMSGAVCCWCDGIALGVPPKFIRLIAFCRLL